MPNGNLYSWRVNSAARNELKYNCRWIGARPASRVLFFMKQLFAALTCCLVAGLALEATPPQKKAAAPSKTAPSPASKNATQKVVAKKTAPNAKPVVASPTAVRPAANRPVAVHATATRATTGHPAVGYRTPPRNRYASYSRPVRQSPVQQAVPTADRYREIQDALAAQGYLKTPSTGVWDKDSIDAMQRFQKDKNLDPTGKLTARSLGLLGLGPKPQETGLLQPNPTASLSANPGNESTPLQ